MAELHINSPDHDDMGGRPHAVVRVQLFGSQARLLLAGYLGGTRRQLRCTVDPGDYVVRMTRSNGDILDKFIEVEIGALVVQVSIDPSEDTPHEGVADAYGLGLLDLTELPAHPAALARMSQSAERHVWLRVFTSSEGHWETGIDGLELEAVAPGNARVTIAGELRARMLQIGGLGVAWQLIVLPPTAVSSTLVIAWSRNDRQYGASAGLLFGNGPHQALLSWLAAEAPANPQELLEVAMSNDRALKADADGVEDMLLLALVALFALRFNLTEQKGGESIGAVAFAKAVEAGQRLLYAPELKDAGVSDLLVVAAWDALRNNTRPRFNHARNLLLGSMRYRLPQFAYALELLHGGLRLLVDAAGGEKVCEDGELLAAISRTRPYVEAAVPRRGYTTFFGQSPTEPTMQPVFGEQVASAMRVAYSGSAEPAIDEGAKPLLVAAAEPAKIMANDLTESNIPERTKQRIQTNRGSSSQANNTLWLYNNHFGLTERPFTLLPDPDFMYWSEGHSRAYAILEYGMLTRAPITVITGEIGAGKTTLLRHLLRSLPEDFTVGLISNAQGNRGELLHWVLMAFGVPTSNDATYVQLFAQFQDFLIEEYASGRRTMLIFDEAQNLSIDTLEELRMLLNINADKDELLQLVLVGQPELRDLISQPRLTQFAQQVAAEYHLPGMSAASVAAYIEHRLKVAGATREIFTPAAAEYVHRASRGIPRLVNQICDYALVYAFTDGLSTIEAATIEQVVKERRTRDISRLAI